MENVGERAVRVLATILVENRTMPWSWSIAPDLRDGGARNAPTVWVVDERTGPISDELANAIRAEQERMKAKVIE